MWNAFCRLSRGRAFLSNTGQPLPLTYRDIRDEVERTDWPDKMQAEEVIAEMDSVYLEIASKKLAEASR